MPVLQVTAAGWALDLRWADRPAAQRPPAEPSSIAVEAAGPFALRLPDAPPIAAADRWEQGLAAPLLFEPRALQVTFEHDEGGAPLTLHHADPLVRAALRDPSGRGRVLSGAIDLDSRVGFFDLDLRRGGLRVALLRLEVFPSKLSFRDDFERMLNDLGAHRMTALIRLLPPTAVSRGLAQRSDRSLAERYQIFDAFFDPIDQALRQIARQPHTGLSPAARLRPADRLRRPDAATRAAATRAGGPRLFVGERDLPARLPDGHREATFDTPANRFVARALRSLSGLLSAVQRQTEARWKDPVLVAVVERRQRSLRRWLAHDFLAEAADRPEAPDLVVQRSPGYRDALRWYRSCLLAFAVVAGDVRLGLQDLWFVYQLWCAVRVEQEAVRLLGEPEGSLVPTGVQGPKLNGRVAFPDGTTITAQAQPERTFGGGQQLPDLLLELRRPAPRGAAQSTFQLVLDAKYRLEWGRGQAKPPQEAINAIHRYRDAMLSADPTRPERSVYGGLILFPHPDEAAYAAEPSAALHDFERMGIGAMPLTPGHGAQLRRWMTELLGSSEVRLHQLGPGYPALPPARRSGTVLIFPLGYGGGQLEQMRADRWAHLPAKWRLDHHRPTHLAPYMANRGGVQELWQIDGWERVDGDRIEREAKFGDGKAGLRPPYWRIQLTGHTPLDPPIRADGAAPRVPWFVPLDVFDLADSMLLLHGEAEHLDLLRVIRHAREVATAGRPDWRLHEPLSIGGERRGVLAGDADGLRILINGTATNIPLESLVSRPIQGCYAALLAALGGPAGRGRSRVY